MDRTVVYGILIDVCGAQPTIEAAKDFSHSWPECGEYRFMGSLGFGGKVWFARYRDPQVYVTCYPEDVNAERQAMLDKANERFAELFSKGEL